MDTLFDLLIIGAGINGAGIARDAAGRGLSVAIVERDDIAAHTSSASTKLIHGGLRYLEYYEFGLVRKSLAERERLLRQAPHLMWPLRFVLPHEPHLRPAWMIRAGLFLYDHLARRQWLPGSNTVHLQQHPAGAALKAGFDTAFEYSDGWTDDARLVLACVQDAAERGALVYPRTECLAAERGDGAWLITLRDGPHRIRRVRARAIVNAAGPWVQHVLKDVMNQAAPTPLRLVRGSHIVVRKMFDHPYAYIFQNHDGRIVFAIPYEGDFTLVGTTDVEVGDPADARVSADEVRYLLDAASHYFARSLEPDDVVHRFGGIRPLLDDGGKASAVTRDYRLVLDTQSAPALSIVGGKITTFRKLAEDAVDLLAPLLGNRARPWTEDAHLPGGDIPEIDTDPQVNFQAFVRTLAAQVPELPTTTILRLARLYGTRAQRILDRGRTEIVPGVLASELDHCWDAEWARSGDDFLWRRTKLGLHLDADQRERIEGWFRARWARG